MDHHPRLSSPRRLHRPEHDARLDGAIRLPAGRNRHVLCLPAPAAFDGAAIPATEATQLVAGLPFQRWSRHRGSIAPWNPRQDNVVTHLALVESALLKEVGE
ncbi:E2/UBC family protein [Rhizobium leguminosarum]|uniref:E2/UBC family protein n=1 Tax=Rhizobium leguminosarum TaxID=384 RepID=UPI0039655B56